MPGYRNWCFTINNPTEQLEPCTWGNKVVYVIWQLEMGNTLHYQGYMELNSQVGIRFLRSLEGMERAHFEARRGSREQARDYCRKEDETTIEGPWEYGTFRVQGKRTDLTAVQEDLDSGHSMQFVAQNHFNAFVRYYKGFEEYLRLTRPTYEQKDFEMDSFNVRPLDLSKPVLLVGPPGFGKTEFAITHFDKCLFVRHMDQLLNLVVGFHDGIVFDELNFKHFPTGARINLLDMRRPAQIHCRYHHVSIPAGMRRIFCNNRDDIFYSECDSADERGAIDRRLQIVKVTKSLFNNVSSSGSSCTTTTTTTATTFNDALALSNNSLLALYTSYDDVIGSDVSSPDPINMFDSGTNLMDLY